MSTFERIADLPVRDRVIRARAAGAGGVERLHPPFDGHPDARRRRGGGRGGRHLRRARPRRAPGGRAGARPGRRHHAGGAVSSGSAASTCSRPSRCARCRDSTAAGPSRAPRSTWRCARPAARSPTQLGIEPRPVEFVVSLRLGKPATIEPVRSRLEHYPTLRFKLDPTSDWTRRADRRAGRRRAPSTRSTSRATTRAPWSTSRPTRISTAA